MKWPRTSGNLQAADAVPGSIDGHRERRGAFSLWLPSFPASLRASPARQLLGPVFRSRRFFDGTPAGAFSLNPLWNKAIAAGRLQALIHDGEWFHVGTPQGLAASEDRLTERNLWPGSI